MKYLEKYLIAYYHSNEPKYGYNLSAGGESGSGLGKPIDQYNRQGVLIRTWGSAAAIERELNYRATAITACARRKFPSAYGFYWVYSGETPEFKTYKTHRKVLQFDLEGNFIAEFKSAVEAGKSLGKGNRQIISCCNKKYKTAYGYI